MLHSLCWIFYWGQNLIVEPIPRCRASTVEEILTKISGALGSGAFLGGPWAETVSKHP
jgi:hypothetical protein